ncbi:MAG: hypothetical protein ED557_08665 [Balneola sp.]|nr:MAG: hypothetical protein ED557_08665 [Balneola sp.]
MRFNFEVGDTFIMNTDAEIIADQLMMGQEIKTIQKITSSEKYEVLNASSDLYTIKMTYLKTTSDTESPMASVKLDSERGDPTDIILSSQMGNSFIFTIDKKGNLGEITGLEEIKSTVTEKLKGTIYETATEEAIKMYSQESIKTLLENMFLFYPQEETDQWSISRNGSFNNMPAQIETDYSLLEETQILAQSNVVIEGIGNFNGFDMDMDISGQQNSTITLNPQNGLPISIVTSNSLEGTLVAQGLNIATEINSQFSITITQQ